MKIHMFFWVFALTSSLLFGQTIGLSDKNSNATPSEILIKVRLSGSISDARSGEPLPGASIFFADEKIGAIADIQGKYTFSNIPAGHHVIEVSHTGYATIVEHIELTTDFEKNFVLSAVITENRAVIITGVSGATSSRKAPVPVTSMGKTALLQTISTNSIDALSRIPGVSQLSTTPAISKPIIRGLGYNRVVTINDGVRQEGQQWGDEHGIEIDELSITRAEVLKGPASLIYGSDALAGVINIITNVPVAEGSLKANLFTNYQTNNGLIGINGSIAGNKNGFNWNAYGTYKSAGDYENEFDGKVLNSRFNEKNFGGYVGLNKQWGYSHLVFSRFDQKVGLVEGDRDDATGRFILFAGSPLERIATPEDLESRDPFIPHQRIQHTKFASDNNFAFRKTRLKVNLAYQNNTRKEFGDPENPSEEELFFDLRTFNYNVQWQLPESSEWHTTVGLNGMLQNNGNKGAEVLIPEYKLFDAGVFIYAQRFFKKSTLSVGVRSDSRKLDSKEFFEGPDQKFVAFERTFSNVSGSIGISTEPSDVLTMKFNLARGFRSPSLAELASNGVHEGTNRYEYGDRKLNSESSLQFDAGIELDYEHFSIGVTGFYNWVNDFIFYRKLVASGGGDSTVFVDGENVPAFRFDQHNARLRGIEANFDVHPHPLDWLHFDNKFSFVRGRFDEAINFSDNLPLIPAPRWISELKGSFNKAGNTFRNLYFKLEADKTFRQDKPFTGFGTETPTPGYTLFNAGIGSDFKGKEKTLFSLHLAVINITDKAYQNHLSRLKYAPENLVTGRIGVFNMGRNFSVKLNVPLEWKWK